MRSWKSSRRTVLPIPPVSLSCSVTRAAALRAASRMAVAACPRARVSKRLERELARAVDVERCRLGVLRRVHVSCELLHVRDFYDT